jgi:predicted ATP-grasp superfamily ATP-dependent carboligase
LTANQTEHRGSILVLGSSRGCSICIIRALGRANYRVIAADSNPKCLGFRSRNAHEKIVYPPPEAHPQKFVDFLLKTVQAKKIDLIIPTTDFEIQPLIGVRDIFEKFTRVALPANELLEVVNDKVKTIQLAQKIGVPVPGTFIARNPEEALRISKNLSWPVVIKPQYSKKLYGGNKMESFGVRYADSPQVLERLMQKHEHKCEVLLQNYHPGTGYGIELLTHNGKPIAAFAHKRLREIPITGGASSYRQSIKLDNRLYAYSLDIMQELNWTGLAMIEFKGDGEDAKLMEINGRVWGSLPLAVASGVNFPLLLTKLFLNEGGTPQPQVPNDYRIGLRCRDLGRDLMWITSVMMRRRRYAFLPMPRRAQAVKAILGFFNPRHRFDLFCFDDPIPAFAEFPAIIRKFRQKIQRPIE